MTPDLLETPVHHVIGDLAWRAPDRELVRFLPSGDVLTAAELDRRAAVVGAGMLELGVQPGDRVLVVAGNRPEFLVAWLACAMTGAVSVPLNTALQGDILDHMVQLTEPSTAIVEADLLAQVSPSLPPRVRRVVVGGAPTGPDHPTAAWEELEAGTTRAAPHDAGPTEPFSIMFTSGTTGPSKGVVFTHGTVLGMAASAVEVMQHGPDDVAFTCLPLFHSNALYTTFLPAIVTGGRAVVAERFSAREFWPQVVASGATLANMLGSLAPILARQEPVPEETAHRLRLSLVIPTPPDGVEAFEERFRTPTAELYGLTDVGIPIGVPHGTDHPAGSCGRELSDWQCRVVDHADRPVADGEMGELIVRPRRPNIAAAGYWGMPEATVEAWRNLWVHTGDLMTRDAEGWFRFIDRGKDAIRRSGENISSFEVEQVISAHPGVEEVAVYAVPSELAEDEVMAAVVAREGARLGSAELLAHCERRLPYFAVPRFIELVDELPRTPTAKIRKQDLRARGVTESTFDAGPRGRRAREHAARETAAATERG